MTLPEVVSWRADGALFLGFVRRLDERKDGKRVYLVTIRDGAMATKGRRRECVGIEAAERMLRRAGWRKGETT